VQRKQCVVGGVEVGSEKRQEAKEVEGEVRRNRWEAWHRRGCRVRGEKAWGDGGG